MNLIVVGITRMVLVALVAFFTSTAATAQSIDAKIAGMSFDSMVESTEESTRGIAEEGDLRYFARAALVVQWLKSQDVSRLSVDELKWCVMHTHPHRRSATAGFSAQWTGSLTPPRSGEYVFSIAPTVVSTEFGSSYHRQWMTVEVNGQRVVDAAPEGWKWEGTPLQLEAGRPVEVDVTFRYQKNGPWRLAPAILFWQGPGLSRSVVPSSAFSRSNGQVGLAGVYRWRERSDSEKEAVLEVTDSSIDFAWTEAGFAFDDLPVVKSVAEELFDRITSEAFLEQYVAEGVAINVHPLFGKGSDQYRRALTYASTDKRREWIERLIANPVVVGNGPLPHVSKLYDALRAGCEEDAVELLGAWMGQHENLSASIAANSTSFYQQNRSAYRTLAVYLSAEHPPSFDIVRKNFLVTDDGGCSLSAAYTLAYASLIGKKMEAWVELLEDKLDDKTLIGERRVNWLLARAMTEEISQSRRNRHYVSPEASLEGLRWIDEAVRAASHPRTVERVIGEKIARLIATNQREWTEQTLADVASNATPETIHRWREQASTAAQAVDEAKESRRQRIAATYRTVLERRRQQAQERGDVATASRYDGMLKAAAAE